MSTEAVVQISKSEIRNRAVAFAAEHANDTSEEAQRQLFWADFFHVFGLKFAQFAAFEKRGRRASTGGIGFIDLLFSGEMAVEHKSLGEDLDEAMGQVHDYLPGLSTAEFPWLLIGCDFGRFRWQDLNSGESGEFTLAELPDHLDLFYWMAGYNRPGVHYDNEEEANLKATALLAAVHDELAETGYPEHDLRQWMTRILFCLFADDSGVWDRATLHAYLALRTNPDGSDLGSSFAFIFQILNQPPDRRPADLDEDLAALTHVNGDLFSETIQIPWCNEKIWNALLEASAFNWSSISPAIFGSLFQNVMTPKERRHLGAHYTTEQNILRVIEPLFLDDLKADLAAANTKPKLEAFHQKLSELTFFDPACGCGNFLVVTYRELRRLETECLRKLGAKDKKAQGQLALDLKLRCRVNVDQFYGIEIEEFPALIARTALYLADHLANRAISSEFGQVFARFPIPTSPHIHIANTLRIDWNGVLPTEECNFVYGNPPFVGISLRTAKQKADLVEVWGSQYHGSLDYVTGWYRKATEYLTEEGQRFSFVSTNSICQGEQLAPWWRLNRPGSDGDSGYWFPTPTGSACWAA